MPTLPWSDTALSQQILKVFILPGKYRQGCGWAALAGSEGSTCSKRHQRLDGRNRDHPGSPLLHFSLILRTEDPDLLPFLKLPHSNPDPCKWDIWHFSVAVGSVDEVAVTDTCVPGSAAPKGFTHRHRPLQTLGFAMCHQQMNGLEQT